LGFKKEKIKKMKKRIERGEVCNFNLLSTLNYIFFP